LRASSSAARIMAESCSGSTFLAIFPGPFT
jgi:hypothetical protein